MFLWDTTAVTAWMLDRVVMVVSFRLPSSEKESTRLVVSARRGPSRGASPTVPSPLLKKDATFSLGSNGTPRIPGGSRD